MVYSYAIALLCVVLAVIWGWQAQRKRKTAPGSNVPLLAGSKPFVGHLLDVVANTDRVYDYMCERVQAMRYKTCAMILPLQPPIIVITSPENLEYVLKTNFANYVKGEFFFSRMQQLLGHGIFTQDGEGWYWQRKLAAHIFSVESFKKYIDVVFADKLTALVLRLSEAAATGQPIDLQALMLCFTLDAFAQLGFGSDPGALKAKGKLPFAVAFDEAQAIINDRFLLPAWPLLELLNGNATKMANNMSTITSFAADIINKRRAQLAAAASAGTGSAHPGGSSSSSSGGDGPAADGQATARVSQSNASDAAGVGSGSMMPASEPKPCAATPQGADDDARGTGIKGVAEKDLLTLFMEAEGPDGKPLTDKQLIDTVLNFLLAGRDTTAQALSWTIYELMRHPEVEAKLLAELQEVLPASFLTSTAAAAVPSTPLSHDVSPATAAAESVPASFAPTTGGTSNVGDGNSSRTAAPGSSVVNLSYDHIRRLRYAKACFMEALRLHPVVAADGKIAVEADRLPDGSIIPKGAQVSYMPYLINRMPTFWGPNAESFRPERWLELQASPNPYSFPTFNAGPRLCLGQRLAELEGVYVLAGMMAQFRCEQVGPKEVTYAASTTLPIKGGLQVLVKARQAGRRPV